MRTSSLAALLPLLLGIAACGGDREGDGGGTVDSDSARVIVSDDRTDPAGGSTSPDLTAICDTIDNSFRCARAIERHQLPSPVATRAGDTLRLSLANGDTVRLVDEAGEGSGVVYYSYQQHWEEPGLLVVQEQHYEGSEFLLIDRRTGERTTVPARPLLAPGGERFAVLSADLVAGYGPNTIQVWRLEDRRPSREWQTEPDGWGAIDGEWLGPARLRFTRECGPETTGEAFCGRPATLTRSDGGWSISDGGGDGG